MIHRIKNIYKIHRLIHRNTNYYDRGRISRRAKIYLQRIDEYFKERKQNKREYANNKECR